MPGRSPQFARTIAAVLVCAVGAAHIGSLWFRELDATAVLSVWIGGVYLMVGLGLFGQSRFTLFVATALCCTAALRALAEAGTLNTAQWIAVAADLTTATCCGMALWGRQRTRSS